MTQTHRQQPRIRVADIVRLPATVEGGAPSWVNGIFEAYVQTSESKRANSGAPFCVMTLSDPSDGQITIEATIWGLAVPPAPGSYVTMTGQGIIRKEYNGRATISGKGDKVTITPISGPSGPAMAQAAAVQAEVVPGRPTGSPQPTAAPVGPPTPGGPPSNPPPPSGWTAPPGTPRFSGPAIGGAVKIAADLIKGIPGRDLEFYDSADFTTHLFRIASHILRVQETISDGRLARKPAEHVPMGEVVPTSEPVPMTAEQIAEPVAPPPVSAGTYGGEPVPETVPEQEEDLPF